MSGELAVRTSSSGLELRTLEDVEKLGKAMAASGMFSDTRDAAKAVVKILAGQELGIPAVAAMQGINIVEGKISYAAGLITALVKQSGRYRYKVAHSDDEKCELEFFEELGRGAEQKWESLGVVGFTIQEAKRAGLVKPRSGWENYPSDMLFARALTRGARRFCADVFQGAVYAEGEIPGEAPTETVPPPPQTSVVEEVAAPAVVEPVADPSSAGEDETQDKPVEASASPGEPPSSADPPEGETVAEIEKLRDKLGLNQGQLLRFARERVGKHIVRPNWAALSGDDSKKLLEALREKAS